MGGKTATWTLQDLAALAARALGDGNASQANGRVREIPDARTIRYYTTIGLLDRPAGWRGRTALYARRHLLQLVAIKRLQAEGLSLVETQERLLGLPDRQLARLARVPAEVLESGPPVFPAILPPPDERPAGPTRRAEAFWKAAPARISAPPAENPEPRPLQALEFGPGATLLFSAARPLTPADVQSLRDAAGPLLDTLGNLGLLERTIDDTEATS
jgi:DNA-binding transcriptional MerR regulator